MPYYRELKDGNKILVSKMLMLTKADAIYIARCMNAAYDDYFYQAAPMLGMWMFASGSILLEL